MLANTGGRAWFRGSQLSSRWLWIACGGLLIVTTAGFLAAARLLTGSGGVPLDDAWIHQTLAFNLARHGQLVIVPGEPSAAATSPLWSALLAVAYWVGLPPLLWALGLGVACLAATAAATYRLAGALFGMRWLAAAAALLTLADWRLVWAALSGMETLLFTALSLTALALVARPGAAAPWLLGAVCGLAAAARPEGLALAALVGAWLFVTSPRKLGGLMAFVLGVLAPLLPVALLNISQYGSPLPATFFAKNAAYGAGFDLHRFGAFWWAATGVLVRGPALLLIPGMVVAVAVGLRRLGSPLTLPLLWAGGLLVAYALWLPALYHHGRYLFPLLPIAVIFGLHGSQLLVQRLQTPRVAYAGAVLIVLYSAYGMVRGAQTYADNIEYINSQQVWAAGWVAAYTPPGATVAAHDIGALSYFTQRPLVDMAGLATPSLVTGPRDVDGVVRILQQREVHVALVIPDWYPPLHEGLVERWGGRQAAQAPAIAGVNDDQRMQILVTQ